MTCKELAGEYDLYALGVLEDPELSELREHLDRNCEVCAPGVRNAARYLTEFSALAPTAEPPKQLRARVLASVGVEPKFRWTWMQTWAAVAASAILGVFWLTHTRDERVRNIAFQDALRQVRQSETESARFKEILALLNAPETIVRVSSEGATQPPQGKVFLNPSRGVLLLASNLPPAPEGKTYEMWVIPAGGKPIPAGLFQTEPNGVGLNLFKGPVDIAATGAVAVTLEAAEGAPQPTSQPIIVASLKKG